MVLPLEGIKVIELGLWVVGPTCARILGELGADVIKVESPAGGDPGRGMVSTRALTQDGRALRRVSPTWEMWNGSKRSIAVDLNLEAGKEIVYKLVQRSDVFITNMRASAVDRLGMDYETIYKLNPKIIYGQNTGFGTKGPLRDRAAFDDTTFWIRSGIMSTLGEPDGPPVQLRGAMGDLSTALFLSFAIVSALLARDRFGIGQKVDISLLSSGVWVAGDVVQRYLIFGEEENTLKYARQLAPNPFRNTYQTKDKKWFFFMMLQSDRFWPAICKALEREDLEKDERFDSHAKRVKNHVELIAVLDEIIATKTREEWAKRFEHCKLIWEPETTVPEALADLQSTGDSYIQEIEHPSGNIIKLLGMPFQFNKTPIGPRSAAPELGQHTEDVLLELGYDWSQISQFKEQKVIL